MVAPLVVTFNDVEYAVAARRTGSQAGEPIFAEDTVAPFREALNTGGLAKLVDVEGVSNVVFPNLTKGFGRDRIDSDSAHKPSEYRYFFNSEGLDTRYSDGIRLGLLEAACTSEVSTAFVVAHAHFGGDFHTLWVERNASGTTQSVVNRVISTTSFGGGGTIEAEDGAADGIRAFDMKALGTNLFVLVNHEPSSGSTTHFYYLMHSTDGTSWTRNSNAIGDTNALGSSSGQGNTYPLDGGLIAPSLLAGRVVLANWDEASKIIEITSFEGTDYADDGSGADTKELSITSGGGVKGLEIYQDIDGKMKLWLGTREGLYIIDASTTGSYVIDDFIRMPAHDDTGRRMVVHQGALWVPVGVDSNQAAPIWRITVQGDSRVVETNAGLNSGDGIPSNLLGPIQWLESAGEQLFALVGGTAASRNSRVLVHNGQGWHSHRINDAANEKYLWLGYGLNDRIYYSVHDNTNGDAVETIANSTVHPLSSSSITREASGFIDLPYLDLGFPLVSGPWLQLGINAEDLSATNSNEYINVDYGIDDGSGGLQARSSTDLGNFLSGTSKINFASGAGVDSVNLGLRINLHRDATTNTDTPKLKDVQIVAIKETPVRERFMFTIDIRATMNLPGGQRGRTAENIVTDWKAARDLKTLATFTYGPVTTSRYVKVRQANWRMNLTEGSSAPSAIRGKANIQREGFVDLVLEEVV